MNQIKWPFLFLAFASVACLAGTGIAIGYRSPLGIILTLIAFVAVMGFGFKTKKKYRESGKL
jgi:FtsH-binding integral membrane protein